MMDSDGERGTRGADGAGAGQFEVGVLIGVLVGEGHFGGDGRQPHVTLRMHTDHEALFRWIERTFPGGKLYGPYDHGGRRYFQWMARGRFLRETLVPLLDAHLTPELDGKGYDRYREMKRKYAIGDEESGGAGGESGSDPTPPRRGPDVDTRLKGEGGR